MKIFKITLSAILCFTISECISQNVNEFTGSLNYGMPLLNIPSNRGNGIPVSASYNAGIAVKQPASEIGLGWNLSAGGAITRNVSGIADDCYGCNVWDEAAKVFRTENGTLYTPGDGDIYRTSRNMDSLDFMFPDYDDYFASGPGMGGKMTPFIFDYEMYTKNGTTNRFEIAGGSYSGKDHPIQFHFNGDFADTLISRHYSVTPVSSVTPFKFPGDNVAGLNGSDNEPYLGKHVNGSSITAENFNPSTNRLGSANYVEYFTNAQIDNISSVPIPGFVDFQSTHTRSSGTYPTNGIGAFRITNSAGFVYHYSLPIYITKTETHTYPLENDYAVPSASLATTLSSYSTYSAAYSWSFNPSVTTKKIIQNIDNKYAYQWLLTAITGPDYIDDGDQIVDDDDTGYWVSFEYKPWCTDFGIRSPHYGFDYSFGLDEGTKRLPISQPLTGTNSKLTGKTGNVNLTFKEIYYLKKIKTTSHTAIFVKDVRKDEVSSHLTTNYTATITPIPQLRTTRVILFKNDRIDSLPVIATISNGGENAVFDFSGTTNGSHFYTENWYGANLSSISSKVLKNVEFTQDYSLCRKYHGNVAVSSLTCSVITPPATVQSNIAATTYSLSGKLTLIKIQVYDLQNVKVIPSYTFDYNQSNSDDNPDYDPSKVDYWGYYKSDVTSNAYSGYTNATSKDYTDAWSLRKIMQPMGGYTEFDYESNSYKKVLDNTSGYRGASFIYPIKTIAINSGTITSVDVTMEESTNPSEFSSLMSGTVSGVTKSICAPMGLTYLLDYPSNYYTSILFGNFTNTGSTSPFVVSSINSYIGEGSNPNCFLGLDNSGHLPGEWMTTAGVEYNGNGYIKLETPVGHEVYGGGPRIKRIKNYNHANEIYVQEYTYEDGVATGEADRFEYPIQKASCGISEYFMNKHTAASFDKHSLGTGIGYSKVTVKNLGRSNTANGSVVSEFITSYTVNGVSLTPNHKITHSYTTTATGSGDPVNYYECFDKYSPFWGLPTERKVLDVNNTVLSKTTYEYQNTEQGAIVENFIFSDNTIYSNWVYNVNILRHYPVVLKKTKSYGMGSYSESETLKRDEVTGEALLVRSLGQNGSTSLSSKIPAFRVSAFSAMGPKSINSTDKNVLSPEAYSFSTVDTTLTPVTSGIGSSFLSAGALVFKTSTNVRTYGGGAFSITTNTLPYWKQGAAYGWSGVQGSLDNYGLYKRSELTSNPFNFSSPSSSSAHWRFGSETTLSDAVGHALETREFNNRFNSIKFGYNDDYVLATCANSNYCSFTYSGFESVTSGTSNNILDGEINLSASSYTLVPSSTITPHTGYKSLALPAAGVSFYKGTFSNNGTHETGIERGRIYRAIVWVSTSSPNDAVLFATVAGSVSGVAYSQNYTMYANDANAITIGNWKRLSVDFKVPDDIVNNGFNVGVTVSLIAGSSTSYFDDFMFYPVEGAVKANVYNPGTGRIIAELNSMGYATFYTYDAAGRVLDTRQEIPGSGIKLVKRNSYNFARTN